MPASPRKRMRPRGRRVLVALEAAGQVGERRERHAREQPRLGPGHHRALELDVERHERPRSTPAGRCRAAPPPPGQLVVHVVALEQRAARAEERIGEPLERIRALQVDLPLLGRQVVAAGDAGVEPPAQRPARAERAVGGALDRDAPVERIEIGAAARGEPVPVVGEAAARRVFRSSSCQRPARVDTPDESRSSTVPTSS